MADAERPCKSDQDLALTDQAGPRGESVKINIWKEDSCCFKDSKKSTIRSFTAIIIN